MKILGVIICLVILSSCTQPKMIQSLSSDDYFYNMYYAMVSDSEFDDIKDEALVKLARCYGDIMSAYPNKNKDKDEVAYNCGVKTRNFYKGDIYK